MPRHYLVTGASGAIGSAVTRRLLADGHAVLAADLAVLEPPPGWDRVGTCSLDVTDERQWADLLATTTDHPLDGAVFCHGISTARVPSHDLDTPTWRRVLDINLTGCFLGLKAVVPGLLDRGWGRLIAVASISAKEASAYEQAYSASKAGLVALVNSTGRELATSGITANSIAPGPVDTELFHAQGAEHVADRLRRTPMGRAAQPDEVAALVAWLASPEASYSTAQCFDLSGGRATY